MQRCAVDKSEIFAIFLEKVNCFSFLNFGAMDGQSEVWFDLQAIMNYYSEVHKQHDFSKYKSKNILTF